jgi:hypothetical protein
MSNRLDIVRRCYRAYEVGDRAMIEPLLAGDFTFYSPPDVGIGLDRYWERCWPASETTRSFTFPRLREIGDDEVIVTYEAERVDGSRFRNTEVFRFAGDRVKSVEVYFGWNLQPE